MGFNFNPLLWFVCRFCRRSFADTDTLKEHKLACHLGECLRIKCIIFEERLLDTEQIVEHDPILCGDENRELNQKRGKKNSPKESKNKSMLDNGSNKYSSFKNPYVLLTKLTEQQINSSLDENFRSKHPGKWSRKKQRILQSSSFSFTSEAKVTNKKECGLQKHKLQRADEGESNNKFKKTDNKFIFSRTACSNDDIYSQEEIRFKKESPIYDVPTTPTNSIANNAANDSLKELKDEQPIVACVSPNSDELPQMQFESFSAPTFYLDQQFQQQFTSPANDDPDVPTEQLEHQEMISCIEAIEFDSNLTNVMIETDNINANLLGTTNLSAVLNQEPHQEHSMESNLRQQSASLLNVQSGTAASEPVAKPYMCETCFALFRTMKSLNQHMLCHSSIKPFKCSKCPWKFKLKTDLNRHMIVHGKKTDMQCRFCCKYFVTNTHLVIHERTHTGDKPFKCQVAHCGFAACSKSVLASHTRSVHSEELGLQQFVCPTCGKTYGLKKFLNDHISIHHSDATPFHCTHQGCTMQFKLKRYLNRHLKKHV